MLITELSRRPVEKMPANGRYRIVGCLTSGTFQLLRPIIKNFAELVESNCDLGTDILYILASAWEDDFGIFQSNEDPFASLSNRESPMSFFQTSAPLAAGMTLQTPQSNFKDFQTTPSVDTDFPQTIIAGNLPPQMRNCFTFTEQQFATCASSWANYR